MRRKRAILIVFSFLCIATRGQVFVYDQQSVTSDIEGFNFYYIQANEPVGQSFTPSLSSIGFVRLFVRNAAEMPSPATMYVNLLEDSISGPVLSQSESISLPSGQITDSPLNFFFATPVTVTPGTTYYLQPVVEDNPNVAISIATYQYAGGTAFVNGTADSANDLWFREGIIVPEPSSFWLILVGSAVWFYTRRTHKDHRLV